MKKKLLSVSLMCCLLAFQQATPAKAQAAGQRGGGKPTTDRTAETESQY